MKLSVFKRLFLLQLRRRPFFETSASSCLFSCFIPRSLLLTLLLLTLFATNLWAWPASGDWIPIYRGTDMLSDPQKDAAGSRDIVGDASNAAAYLFNDGNYTYFRVRLDASPLHTATTLSPFGWGFLLDTNLNLDDYEYMIMLDGISNPDVMYLARNTYQGIIGEPSDKAEVILWQESLSYNNNYRVLGPLDSGGPTTIFGGDGDYYLDFFVPYDVLSSTLGLTEASLLRYFVGSSNSAQTLSADLVAGSTLYDGSSNFVLPSGSQPTTGSVYFVSNVSGTINLTEFYAGATVYLKVIDADLNTAATSIQMINVAVTSPSGDSQTVTLTETGANTGIFTGPLATSDGLPAASDGILQVTPIEIITVNYIDGADGTTPVPLQNQLRTDTARALPAADIAVSKSVNNPTPNEGEIITYTIRTTNVGPSSASGIQINDSLPAGVTYVSHSAPADTSYNPGTGLWSAGSLAKNSYKELTITATVNADTAQTTIRNTASRSAAAQPDPNSANDTAYIDIAVTGANLSITKTANNTAPSVGGTVRFTITVANNGTYPATNVIVTDALPTGTWSSVAVVSTSQGTTSYNGSLLTWDIGTIPYPGPGNTVTLVVDATLAAGVTSGTSVTNTATISQVDQTDPQPDDDSASVTLVVGGIDLSISKVVSSPSPATPNVGDAVVFIVTVTNSNLASTTADGVEITDLLPADLTYLSAVPSEGIYASSSGKWSNISLAPNESQTLTLTATVKAGTAGKTITNFATITGYNQTDVNTSNHAASASLAVKAADLQVIKTVSNPTPANGEIITYTITVNNVGYIAATGVSIFDQLPGQVTYNSADSGGNGSYSTATNLWSGISLDVGTSATLAISVTVNLAQNDPKTFFNTASLNSSTPEDNNATNDVSSAVVSVNGTDLGVSKVMNIGYTDYPASGSNTQFLITLTNYGPNTATGITVNDVVPTGLSCTAATVSVGTFTQNKCEWNIATLASGASATMVLTSAVTAANGTTLTNRATVTAIQADPAAGNNTASKVVYVGASDLSLTKSVDNTTPNIGERVKFTVTLTNNGSNSVNNIEVMDLLPPGLTLLVTDPYAPYPSQGSYADATGIWTVGTITYPGSATLDLYATVDTGTGGTVITNEARITAAESLDPNTANNRANASVTVQLADVYVTKEADTLTPFVGETVTFTITAGNNGPNSASGIVVRDLLASNPDEFPSPSPIFTNLIYSSSQGSYDPATGDWNIGTIPKDTIATLTLTATLAIGSEGKNITNHAYKLSEIQADSNSNNDSQTVVLTPQLLTIDLQLTKSVDNPSPVEGSNVVFTLTLYNLHGSRSATGIIVTDTLPAGLTFVSAATATGSITSTPAVDSFGDVVWNVGPLAAMSNVTLILTAKTACGSAESTLTNSATISAKDQLDLISGNNTATRDVIPTAALPNLTIVKLAGAATAQPGTIINYLVQVSNFGCGKATSIVLTDYLSEYGEFRLDYNGAGAGPFNLSYAGPDPSPDPIPSLDDEDYSYDGGNNWVETSAASGEYDNELTNWQVPIIGPLIKNGVIQLRYQVKVK